MPSAADGALVATNFVSIAPNKQATAGLEVRTLGFKMPRSFYFPIPKPL